MIRGWLKGLVVAMNQSNVLRSKEALLLAKFAGTKEKDISKGFSLIRHGGFGDCIFMSANWKH